MLHTKQAVYVCLCTTTDMCEFTISMGLPSAGWIHVMLLQNVIKIRQYNFAAYLWNSLHVMCTYDAYIGSSAGIGALPCCRVIIARSFTLQEKTLICLIVSGIKMLSEAQQQSLDSAGICLDTVTLCSMNWGQKRGGHSRQWILQLYSVIGCSTSVRIDDSSRFFVYRAAADTIKPGFQNELSSIQMPHCCSPSSRIFARELT